MRSSHFKKLSPYEIPSHAQRTVTLFFQARHFFFFEGRWVSAMFGERKDAREVERDFEKEERRLPLPRVPFGLSAFAGWRLLVNCLGCLIDAPFSLLSVVSGIGIAVDTDQSRPFSLPLLPQQLRLWFSPRTCISRLNDAKRDQRVLRQLHHRRSVKKKRQMASLQSLKGGGERRVERVCSHALISSFIFLPCVRGNEKTKIRLEC